MEVCAEQRSWANGRVEVARSAVVREMAVGNMREMLAHDAAHDAQWAAERVAMAEVRPKPPMEPGRAACSQARLLKGAQCHEGPATKSGLRNPRSTVSLYAHPVQLANADSPSHKNKTITG